MRTFVTVNSWRETYCDPCRGHDMMQGSTARLVALRVLHESSPENTTTLWGLGDTT